MPVTVTLPDGVADKYMRFGDVYVKHNDGTLDVIRGGARQPYSYAAGQWTDAVRASLPAAGFKAAVTAGPDRSDQRLVRPSDPLTLLPRIGITDRMTLATFAARLAGL